MKKSLIATSPKRAGKPAGKCFVLFLCGLLILPFCNDIQAQTTSTSIRGIVTDADGGAIAGATITLTNSDKGFTRSQVTDNNGEYVFAAIPPDTYRLEAKATGFKQLIVGEQRVLVDTPTTVNLRLETGKVTESVEVAAKNDAPLNTTDATIGNAFEQQRIEQLPLNARNVVGLLSLQPGVTRFGEVNGSRRNQANVTLDGVDNNEQQAGLDVVTNSAFASTLRVTPDSVQEFRVTTSVPNANQGRSSGAQVTLVTRSGTNQFHGSLYYFNRNTETSANDYFNNLAGRFTATDVEVIRGQRNVGDERIPRPKLLRNIYGGSLGGPILRDKLFFFYNYEGRRDSSETSVVRTVPTQEFRQGIIRYQNTAGGISTITPANLAQLYPATGGLNPAVLRVLQLAPLPNDLNFGDGLNLAGYRFNAITPNELTTHIGRFDFNINDRQKIFVRGNYQQDVFNQARQFEDSPAPRLWVHPIGFVVGHDWAISNNLFNAARFGLTRQALSQQGDADRNVLRMFTYRLTQELRTSSRTTPTFNVTDDVTFARGGHTFQFGGNVRFIQSDTASLGQSFDLLSTNFAFYGGNLTAPITNLAPGFLTNARAAIAIALGRLTQYSANIIFDRDGNITPVGTPAVRSFATQEYEAYAQDVWRLRPNLTLTYGLRYGISRPVYERTGHQVQPTVKLGDLYERRRASADNGVPLNELIAYDLSGPANNRPGYYDYDKNNFAPNVSVAYSPNFWKGFFGRNNESVIRGGFRVLYDRLGNSVASVFDANNTLGFSSSTQVPSGIFNVTTNPPPLFTGLDQNIRNLPNLGLPGQLSYPRSQPANEATRSESSFDSSLKTPVQYTWNLSYGRALPAGLTVEISYVGRAAKNLLAGRDVMTANNLREMTSRQTYYEAANILGEFHDNGLLFTAAGFNQAIPNIPFFENLFPGNRIRTAAEAFLGRSLPALAGLTPSQQAAAIFAGGVNGLNINNPRTLQTILDDSSVLGRNIFIHPQYAGLTLFSTIGYSNYHGGSLSVRQRLSESVLLDFNYTFSKSLDTGSPLEGVSITNSNEGLILNPADVRSSYAASNFDIRHNVNANFLVQLPIGRDRRFLNRLPKALDVILGGWQLAGVYRYHSGLPFSVTEQGGGASLSATQVSRAVLIRPLETSVSVVNGRPYIFSDPNAAYQSFRNARAGEPGSRNVLRLPGYSVLDASLSKSFKVPFVENHTLQFRWEVFNVTNTQPLGTIENTRVDQDPFRNTAPASFGRFSGSQTPIGETRPGRVMQFALRYQF